MGNGTECSQIKVKGTFRESFGRKKKEKKISGPKKKLKSQKNYLKKTSVPSCARKVRTFELFGTLFNRLFNRHFQTPYGRFPYIFLFFFDGFPKVGPNRVCFFVLNFVLDFFCIIFLNSFILMIKRYFCKSPNYFSSVIIAHLTTYV